MHVIKVIDVPGTVISGEPYVDVFIRAADVDAHGGEGMAFCTTDPKAAIQFESAMAAYAYWLRQSRVLPLREDGQPNRPLTTFTVEILSYEEAIAETNGNKPDS